ncbi:hypothetical protein [Microcoleus phage My-WqHQDG]|nr:hypothetical protein [Microcoleus phage My-WqHQDG]
MLGLFSTKTASPSQMFETLGKLQTKRGELIDQLTKTDAEISILKANLNQLLGNAPAPANTPAQHNQPLGTTQVTPAQHNRTTQQPAMTQVTNPPNTIPKAHNTVPASNVIQSRLAPSVQPSPPTGNPTPSATNAGIANMAAIVNDRAPYHTEELQITGVQPQGQIVLYKHYLSGDGINSGIPALEGCVVTMKQSASGNVYRQMETPALKITCTLSKPLPTGFAEQKRAIREWLAANEYLTTCDPNKTQFECEYDAYGNLYTPYVSVDTKGLNLFIYIGCASMTSAKPCPTLIA